MYGNWGLGKTVDEARANLKKAGGKLKDGLRVFSFASDFPFAPTDRPAKLDEADAWVGRDGSINWVRCERTEVA